MSSHHIVREKQEPALLILSLDGFEDELLGQLLEWSPTIIVTPETAEKTNSIGIKIDLIISPEVSSDTIQSDIKYIPAGEDGIIEAALKYLIINTYPAVNVITDVFVLKHYLYYQDKINMVIYCGNRKIYPVQSGFSKWKPAGEPIEMMGHAPGLHTMGLNLINDNRYTTAHDGFFTLRFEQPFIFIAENIG